MPIEKRLRILGEILSEKYGCRITLTLRDKEPAQEGNNDE